MGPAETTKDGGGGRKQHNRTTGFDIAVASEVMSVLAVSKVRDSGTANLIH